MKKKLLSFIILLCTLLSSFTIAVSGAQTVVSDEGRLPFEDVNPSSWDGDAAALGLLLQEEAGEVRIIAVWDDSPAHRAGLRPGDRLLTVNGQSVTDAAALEAILSQISPGAGVTFTAERTGVNGAVEAVIAPR